MIKFYAWGGYGGPSEGWLTLPEPQYRILHPEVWQLDWCDGGDECGGGVPLVSSLGRYVFGSEISYNKAPPRLPGLGCLNKPKSQKIVGHWIPKSWWTMNSKKFMDHEFRKIHGPWISKNRGTLITIFLKIFFYEKNCVVPGKYVLIIIFCINCVFRWFIRFSIIIIIYLFLFKVCYSVKNWSGE